MTTITAPTGSFEIRFPFDFMAKEGAFPQGIKTKIQDIYSTLQMDESGTFTVDHKRKKQLYKDIMTEIYGQEFFDENGVALIK